MKASYLIKTETGYNVTYEKINFHKELIVDYYLKLAKYYNEKNRTRVYFIFNKKLAKLNKAIFVNCIDAVLIDYNRSNDSNVSLFYSGKKLVN